MTERALCVVAHPDDEALGCGATLALHRKNGNAVMVVTMADGVTSRDSIPEHTLDRRRRCLAALKILGITQNAFGDWPDNKLDTVPMLYLARDIEHAISVFKPTMIYTHHGGDLNIDHRIVHEAVRVACRPQPGNGVRQMLFFEVPSSTEWGLSEFHPNYYVNIEETLETKIEALMAYGDEMRDWPHARSIEAVRHLAKWRGATVGLEAAEAFVVGRTIC